MDYKHFYVLPLMLYTLRWKGSIIIMKAILFGTGAFAEVVDFYLSNDSDYEVVGFCATSDQITETTFLGSQLAFRRS